MKLSNDKVDNLNIFYDVFVEFNTYINSILEEITENMFDFSLNNNYFSFIFDTNSFNDYDNVSRYCISFEVGRSKELKYKLVDIKISQTMRSGDVKIVYLPINQLYTDKEDFKETLNEFTFDIFDYKFLLLFLEPLLNINKTNGIISINSMDNTKMDITEYLIDKINGVIYDFYTKNEKNKYTNMNDFIEKGCGIKYNNKYTLAFIEAIAKINDKYNL